MMPLLDHFGPTARRRDLWHGLLAMWSGALTADLNRRLPAGYFAQPHAVFKHEICRDSLRDDDQAWWDERERTGDAWLPPDPEGGLPFEPATGTVEVQVFDREGDRRPSAAILLVTPINKEPMVGRDAFVARVGTHLRDGVGVVAVDIVTDPTTDWHGPLLAHLGGRSLGPPATPLLASAYRPDPAELKFWREPLRVGGELPVLPLWFRTGLCVPVDLESTYQQTCRSLRIEAGRG